MPRPPPPAVILGTAILVFLTFIIWVGQRDRPQDRLVVAPAPMPKWLPRPGTGGRGGSKANGDAADTIPTVAPSIQVDKPIMARLGNETLKADLGRAAWKLFHTTMARFPDSPTSDESSALKSYIYLFARLYPCGECAAHFQQILTKYPPQVSSRSAAAVWACFVHNEVNKSKGKEVFDCGKIGEFYDCGCEDEEKEKMAVAGSESEKVAKGGMVREIDVEVEREGPTRGG